MIPDTISLLSLLKFELGRVIFGIFRALNTLIGGLTIVIDPNTSVFVLAEPTSLTRIRAIFVLILQPLLLLSDLYMYAMANVVLVVLRYPLNLLSNGAFKTTLDKLFTTIFTMLSYWPYALVYLPFYLLQLIDYQRVPSDYDYMSLLMPTQHWPFWS
jgi:hypothetical protein